ncbi:hypothetical protein [Ensifer sp. ENS10]|uniref:hypothetical protein n=1 Tax=Ensifer sp. ENS10 TaxID=2769286 RepID=UPI001FEF46DF|nr:hypothetical protein [Ensifer sp. ENS10]
MPEHAGDVVGFDAQDVDQELELKSGIFDAHRLLVVDGSEDRIQFAIQNADQMLVCRTYGILQLRILEPEQLNQCVQFETPIPPRQSRFDALQDRR